MSPTQRDDARAPDFAMPADWDEEPDWGRTEWAPDDPDLDGADDEAWTDDDSDLDESETRRCPECTAEVLVDLDHCPHCGHWWIEEPRSLDNKPLWYLVLGLLGVVAVIVLYSGLLQWLLP